MQKGILICLLYFIGNLFLSLNAQEKDSLEMRVGEGFMKLNSVSKDTIDTSKKPVTKEKKVQFLDLEEIEFKPNSKKAVIYSAILPGLGQIYNRKYWKLPIIYGGAVGVVYAVTWNGRYYDDYGQAFKDLALGTGTSWTNFTDKDLLNDTAERERYLRSFKRQRDFYRRNRDLAVIVGVALYALNMIDAYVDAQLYDFNMSPDLSMNVAPVVWGPTPGSSLGVGVQCRITF